MVQTDRHRSALVGCGDETGENRTIPLTRSELCLAGLIARDEDEGSTDGNRSAVTEPAIVGGPIDCGECGRGNGPEVEGEEGGQQSNRTGLEPG